jgi:hypothetical protein
MDWWPRAELNHRHKDFQLEGLFSVFRKSVTWKRLPIQIQYQSMENQCHSTATLAHFRHIILRVVSADPV